MSFLPTRRDFLFVLLVSAAVGTFAPVAMADNGEDDDGGDDNSGSGGGDNSGSGNSDSDDDNDDGDDHNSNSGHGSIGSGREEGSESERASNAVRAKKAVPLRTLMAHLRQNYPGKVLDVDLKRSIIRYSYSIKILSSSGKVQRLKLDALTLRKL